MGKKGADWRCKECHGWDYMGAKGAYSKGKHHTGFKGVSGAAGSDPVSIIATLKDKTHQMGGKMAPQDFADLANFVSEGQFDMDRYIDRKSKAMINGNGDKGAAYYNTICANCHGVNGDLPEDMPKTLGKLTNGNPWEVMHKTLNGQPDEDMLALRALPIQVTVDIMAHMSTLPTSR